MWDGVGFFGESVCGCDIFLFIRLFDLVLEGLGNGMRFGFS